MSDYILIENDQVIFMPTFGAAAVVTQPGSLKGSGPATLNGSKLCVDGDEKDVAVSGCIYTTPQYCIPGSGTLKIASLTGRHKAKKTQTGGKAILLKGGNFTAKFEVQSPAQQPNPDGSTIPDSTTEYSGTGMFTSMNTQFQGA